MQIVSTLVVLGGSRNHSVRQRIGDQNIVNIENNGLAATLLHILAQICTLGIYGLHRDTREFECYKENIGTIRSGLVQLRNSDAPRVPIQLPDGTTLTLQRDETSGVIFSIGEPPADAQKRINGDINSIIEAIDHDVLANPADYGKTLVAAFRLSQIFDEISESDRPASVLENHLKVIARDLAQCLQDEGSDKNLGFYRKTTSKLGTMFITHVTKYLDDMLQGSINRYTWQAFQTVFHALNQLSPLGRTLILSDCNARKFELVAHYSQFIKDEAATEGVTATFPYKIKDSVKVIVSPIEGILEDIINNGLTSRTEKAFDLVRSLLNNAEESNLREFALLFGHASYRIKSGDDYDQRTWGFVTEKNHLGKNILEVLCGHSETIFSIRCLDKNNLECTLKNNKDLTADDFAVEVIKYLHNNPNIRRLLVPADYQDFEEYEVNPVQFIMDNLQHFGLEGGTIGIGGLHLTQILGCLELYEKLSLEDIKSIIENAPSTRLEEVRKAEVLRSVTNDAGDEA